MKNPDQQKEEFEHFASMMVELVSSFKEVMKTGDEQTKLMAIDMFSHLKEKMGETFYHLMEKHDIYPEDLEQMLEDDQNEMTQKVMEVNSTISSVNDSVTKEIEKTLTKAGVRKKKSNKTRKRHMVKRLRSKY